MTASRNSKTSPISELLAVAAVLAAISSAAAGWFYAHDYLYDYGDAESHLNIARRLFDSRTPNYEQIGTVWLPLPHLLVAPLARNDELWRSGLAGAIPSALCLVAAGVFLFAGVRRLYSSTAAGVTAALLLALNPNILYLQSTAMTEPVFLAAMGALLYFLALFRDTQSVLAVAAAGLSATSAALTRYEGWFLPPIACALVLLLAKKRRATAAILFFSLACAGPLYWLAHNWWCFGDALEFYRGPYSAKAIAQRDPLRFIGQGDWAKTFLYYRTAVAWCAGRPLLALAAIGTAAGLIRRAWWPLPLLAATPLLTIWSMHAGDTRIYVPDLWPNTYYNARYGLLSMPLLAVTAAGLVALLPRWRGIPAALVVLAGVSAWIVYPRMEGWICWKESRVNSEARRAWTGETAAYLRASYRGGGILTSFGDLAGVYRQAGIPLKEVLHEGNEPYWQAAVARPNLMLHEEWVVSIAGDKVSAAIGNSGSGYGIVCRIVVKGAPAIEIRRRGYTVIIEMRGSR